MEECAYFVMAVMCPSEPPLITHVLQVHSPEKHEIVCVKKKEGGGQEYKEKWKRVAGNRKK